MLPMNAGLASRLLGVVAMVSIAPAENPIMPRRSGSTCHFAALVRTRTKAALASATWGAMRAAISPGDGRVAGAAPIVPGDARVAGAAPAVPGGRGPVGRANASRSAGVWLRRYL